MSIADEPSAVNQPPELDAVVEILRRQLRQPDLRLDGPPHRLRGGFWAELWLLTLSTSTATDLPQRVVLRLSPDAAVATWETTIQAAVAEQGYPTPAVRAADLTGAAGSRAWCVMDHAEGTTLLGGLSGRRAITALPRLVTSLPDTLARAAAELHRLDPAPVESALAAATDRAIGIDGFLDHYLTRANELGDAPLRRAVERLAASRPDSARRVVCHGDLHPFNLLTDGGRTTVLDWTAGQIAHPEYDLAFTHLLLAHPPLDVPRALRPVVDAAARRIAGRFMTTYRRIAAHPIDADTLRWYRDLQGCRILTDLAEWRAAGELTARRGHPWFTLQPSLQHLLDPSG